MKRISLFIAAAFAAVSFASCTKQLEEVAVVENSFSAKDIVLDLNINALAGDATKAVKTDWSVNDKLNIWFDENMVNSSSQADLVIKYTSEGWVVDSEVAVSGAAPHASGTMKVLYEGYNDFSGNYTNAGYAPSFDKYLFDRNYPYAAPMMVAANNISYTYADSKLSANINSWTYLTSVQVVVEGLNSARADHYFLKTWQLVGVQGCYVGSSEITVRENSDNKWQQGVANQDGVAFYFTMLSDYNGSYTMYLYDEDNNEQWAFVIPSKSFAKDNSKCKSIIINRSKFNQLTGCEKDGLSYEIYSGTAARLMPGNFYGSAIYSGDVTVPASITVGGNTYDVRSIGNSAFYGCSSLTSVSLPEGLTYIDSKAFTSTSLTSLELPSTLTGINESNSVFNGSTNLDITIRPGNTTYVLDNKILYKKSSEYDYMIVFVPEYLTGDIVLHEKTYNIVSNGTLNSTNADSIEFPEHFTFGTWGAFRGTIKDGLVLKFNNTSAAWYKSTFGNPVETYRFGSDNSTKIVLSLPSGMSDADFAEIQTWAGTTFKSVVRR